MGKFDPNDRTWIIYACLIPVPVLFSGVFAGLTLGYMSLDTTQLNVLSISATPCVYSLLVEYSLP
jgi:metal transporter CNNM